MTLVPSESFTVLENAPLLTAAASPSTSTAARFGETRPRTSTLSSLTVEVSAGASTVRRTAGGSGGGRSSPPHPASANTARRARAARGTAGPRLPARISFAKLISRAYHSPARSRLPPAPGHLAHGAAAASGG